MIGALGIAIMIILGFKFFKDELLIYMSLIIIGLGILIFTGNYVLANNPELVEKLNVYKEKIAYIESLNNNKEEKKKEIKNNSKIV